MTKTNSIKGLTDETIATIKELIATELLKRGYTAAIYLDVAKDRQDKFRLALSSEPFQTTPVIFKSLHIQDFGFGISENKEHEGYFNVWMPVNVRWEHFNGGTNGTDLFTLWCTVGADDYRLQEVTIK